MDTPYSAAISRAYTDLHDTIEAFLPFLGSRPCRWANIQQEETISVSCGTNKRARVILSKGASRSAHATLWLHEHTPELADRMAVLAMAIRRVPALDSPQYTLKIDNITPSNFSKNILMRIGGYTLSYNTWEHNYTHLMRAVARIAHLPAAGTNTWRVRSRTIVAPNPAQALVVYQALLDPTKYLPTQPSKCPKVYQIVEAKTLLAQARTMESAL